MSFASKKSLSTGIKEIEERMAKAKLPMLLKSPSSFIDNRQKKASKDPFVHKRRVSALIRIQSDSVVVKEKRDTTNDNDWFLKAFKDASFQAEDSIRFNEDRSIMKLYGNAKVKSKNYSMKGDLIKIDYKEKRVYCIGNAEIQDRTSAIAK
jgi:lipopolysaccharide assembly outer membrane protein LptD (OstA)